MTRRRIEIMVAVLILLFLGGLLWWLFHKAPTTTTSQQTVTTKTLPQQTTTTTTTETPATTQATKQTLPPTAQTVGRSFVERFGSFSNESEYKNIYDVLSMATPSLQKELKTLAETAKANETAAYYGISTQVISVKTTSTTDTQVKLTITTRRSESIDSPGNTTTRTQDITLTLLKNGEDWLVDDYAWQS